MLLRKWFEKRARDPENQPYSFLGDVLVKINPIYESEGQEMGVFDKISSSSYKGEFKVISSPPCPETMADMAVEKMLLSKNDQMVIVSGEIGSGKSHASKTMVQRLTAKNRALQTRLKHADRIVSAFATASTRDNDDSSRVSLLMKLFYDVGDSIPVPVGARIDGYGLEVTRVTSSFKSSYGERNFNIFHQLLHGRKSSTLGIDGNRKFSYIVGVQSNSYDPNEAMGSGKSGDSGSGSGRSATRSPFFGRSAMVETTSSSCSSREEEQEELSHNDQQENEEMGHEDFVTSRNELLQYFIDKNDECEFSKFVESMAALGLDLDPCLDILAAILHLGNIHFTAEHSRGVTIVKTRTQAPKLTQRRVTLRAFSEGTLQLSKSSTMTRRSNNNNHTNRLRKHPGSSPAFSSTPHHHNHQQKQPEVSSMETNAPVFFESHVACCATLLGISESELTQTLCGGKTTAQEAIDGRDALARALYRDLFEQVVESINRILMDSANEEAGSSRQLFVGVLDVIGSCYHFQTRESGTGNLEDLLANATNELLEKEFFNTHVLRMERMTHNVDFLDLFQDVTEMWKYVPSDDKMGCVDLLFGRLTSTGLLCRLDQVSTAARGVNRVRNDFNNTHVFDDIASEFHHYTRFKMVDESKMEIQHAGGAVIYDLGTLVSQNTNVDLATPIPFLGNNGTTTLSYFRSSIRDLVTELIALKDEACVSFVRCIRPNRTKMINKSNPDWFDAETVEDQLRVLNLPQTQAIMKLGAFCNKISFLALLRPFWGTMDKSDRLKPKRTARYLLERVLKVPQSEFRVCKTGILFSSKVIPLIRQSLKPTQAEFRKFRQVKIVIKWKRIVHTIQICNYLMKIVKQLHERRIVAAKSLQNFWRVQSACKESKLLRWKLRKTQQFNLARQAIKFRAFQVQQQLRQQQKRHNNNNYDDDDDDENDNTFNSNTIFDNNLLKRTSTGHSSFTSDEDIHNTNTTNSTTILNNLERKPTGQSFTSDDLAFADVDDICYDSDT